MTIREINHEDSRVLVDIDENHAYWKASTTRRYGDFGGAIVRLCPPPGITDAELADVERQVREAGAAAVKVQRRVVQAHVPAGLPGGSIAFTEEAQQPRDHGAIVSALLLKTNASPELRAVVLRALEEGQKASKPVLKPRAGEPLYVTAIRLANWQRFRGTHAVELEPMVYAITAEHEDHPGRSNWLGKSSFLGAIPFALFGWHTRPREDAWITDGEAKGGVSLTLSDGTTIIRSRDRGKATRLVLKRPDGSQAHGDEAQREISERVGLGEPDFFSTSFLVQKTIGQFVTMQPSKRQELVAGWLDLGPLRAAEDWARDQLDAAAEREGKAREARAEWDREILGITIAYQTVGGVSDIGLAITQWIDAKEACLKEAQEHAGAVRSAGQVARQREAIARAQAAKARAAAELGSAERDSEGVDRLALQVELDAAREEEARARSARDAAAKEEGEKKRLLVAGFDGRCPVAGIDCPATKEINARRGDALERHAGAKHVLSIRDHDYGEAQQALRDVEQRVRVADMRTHALREKQRAYQAACEALDALGPMPPEVLATETVEQVDARVRELAREVGQARDHLARLQRAQEARTTAEAAADQAAKEADLYGAAARLLGRGEGGTQREVALSALAIIEANTNAGLAAAGVDLTVSLRWGSESTTELAPYCNACGASYPNSKRVKACPRCGAARGPKLDDKLDFSLSNRSGAAEDLAGFHLQIAAASWLYGRRGVPWRVVAVDEPFGALDEAHRKAMGAHVAGLLRKRYAFEQAFVIAHDLGSTDAMPGRIRIIAGADGSRVEVES